MRRREKLEIKLAVAVAVAVGPEGGMGGDGVWRGDRIAVERLEETSRWDLEWRLELEDSCQSVWRVAVELLPRKRGKTGLYHLTMEEE